MIDFRFEEFEKENPDSMTARPLTARLGGTELAQADDPRRGSIGQSSSEKGVSNEEPSSQTHKAHTARFHTD
jgi:hypothetical protein